MLLPPADYGRGPDHFCLALHVAMQIGPYLHAPLVVEVLGVWSLRILDYVQPFLLINRTSCIVTALFQRTSSKGYNGLSSI